MTGSVVTQAYVLEFHKVHFYELKYLYCSLMGLLLQPFCGVVIAFADDVVIVCSSNNWEDITNIIGDHLQLLQSRRDKKCSGYQKLKLLNLV